MYKKYVYIYIYTCMYHLLRRPLRLLRNLLLRRFRLPGRKVFYIMYIINIYIFIYTQTYICMYADIYIYI